MKKLWIGAFFGLLILGSCAQNKEKREEFKNEHDKDSLRNKMGDSAVANSEYAPTDTVKSNLKRDSIKVK